MWFGDLVTLRTSIKSNNTLPTSPRGLFQFFRYAHWIGCFSESPILHVWTHWEEKMPSISSCQRSPSETSLTAGGDTLLNGGASTESTDMFTEANKKQAEGVSH